jgi:hypothetical protein
MELLSLVAFIFRLATEVYRLLYRWKIGPKRLEPQKGAQGSTDNE